MKKFLKQVIFGLLVFIGINTIISVFYEYPVNKAIKDKTHKYYLKWNDIHNNKNAYDLIVIGTSRAYAAYNPVILDSTLQIKSYNIATSAQDIAETYYTLQEVFDYQNPKYVVLDLFLPSSDNVYEFYQTLSNSRFYNSTSRRYNLITEGYGSTGILNYAIPLVRFKNYIKQDIGGLFSDNKTERQEDNWIKGYLHDAKTVTEEKISQFSPVSNFENTNFDKTRFNNYFNKIKTLVESNGAKLVCVRAPYPPSRLKLSKVDDEGNYFKALMEKKDIPFFDLNTYKIDSLSYLDSDFADYHHANYRGAEKASKQLSNALKKSNL